MCRADIPKAIVAHEVLGLAMALGFWTACYALQPSKTFMRPVVNRITNQRMEQAYSTAMLRAQRTVQSWSWLRNVPVINRSVMTSCICQHWCQDGSAI